MLKIVIENYETRDPIWIYIVEKDHYTSCLNWILSDNKFSWFYFDDINLAAFHVLCHSIKKFRMPHSQIKFSIARGGWGRFVTPADR